LPPFAPKPALNVRQIGTRSLPFNVSGLPPSLQGVLKRHLDGNASADNAASVGGQAKLVASLGEDILSGLHRQKG
jgi:hypothetical protein